jgi:predicted lipopolysaccharide heptosyltransferase III
VNILLVQLKRIGDLILTTPAISAVRARFPDAQIALVASAGSAELLPAIGGIDRKLISNQLRSWLEISRGTFDYCIDFTRTDRSSFLTRLSRAKTRVAIQRRKQQTTFRSRAYNQLVPAPLGQLHTIDHAFKLLEPLGISGEPPPLQLDIPDASYARADELRSKHHIRGDFLIFHPGSARPEKFWPAERWAEVIATARAQASTLVVTGGMSIFEQRHIAEVKQHLRFPIIDLSGQLDLLTLAALISQARLLVTVDSAPMHLAAAVRTPQLALFGPTNPFHWRPRSSTAVVLQGDSAVPQTEFSPNQIARPMKQISTAAVIDAMNALLSTPVAKGS